jgi:hypothetical protein
MKRNLHLINGETLIMHYRDNYLYKIEIKTNNTIEPLPELEIAYSKSNKLTGLNITI